MTAYDRSLLQGVGRMRRDCSVKIPILIFSPILEPLCRVFKESDIALRASSYRRIHLPSHVLLSKTDIHIHIHWVPPRPITPLVLRRTQPVFIDRNVIEFLRCLLRKLLLIVQYTDSSSIVIQ